MGVTKTENFTAEQNHIANICKAIGHPARVAILEQLLVENSCVCGNFVDDLPLAQATVSQHLRALKEANLIKGNVEGTSVCYCIHTEGWKKAQHILADLFEKFTDPDCC